MDGLSKFRCVVGDTLGGGWRCALPTHSEDGGGALCQLTRRMVFELAKQLRISIVVGGGFANSSHRVLERVGKTYPCLTVRFANSLGGWCLSWQSNYRSAQWSVAALPTHHTVCRGELAKPILWIWAKPILWMVAKPMLRALAPPFPTSVENPKLTDNPRLLILVP